MILKWTDFLPSIVFKTNPILNWSSSSHLDIHTVQTSCNSSHFNIILSSLEYAYKDAI